MKNNIIVYITNKLEWTKQLFWEIGWMSIQFIKGDIKGGIEMTYWIRIHLSYKGNCIRKNVPFWTKVKIASVTIFGILITAIFIYGLKICISYC